MPGRRRAFPLIVSLTILLASVLTLAPALAEDTESSPGLVEHVQVITTHTPEKTETTPASVTVMTREDLVRRGACDLRSALRILAGLDVAPGGDAGPAAYVPEFWGLKEFDAFLLTVDGVPWGGAFNPSLATLTLNDVERIEVLRGAAPVSYGATSFVGVINVVHGEPGSGGETLRLSGGSYGSGSISWAKPLPEWNGVKSSLDLDVASQGFKDDRTSFDRGHLLWSNSVAAGKGKLRFSLDGFWQRQDPASPHPRIGAELTNTVPVDANQNMLGAHMDEQRHTAMGTYERPYKSGSWSTTLSFSDSRQDLLRGFLIDGSPPPDNAHGFREVIPNTDIYLDSHMTLNPSKKVEIVAGIDHLHGQGHAKGGDFDYSVNLDGSAAPGADSLPDEGIVRIKDRRDFSGLYGELIFKPKDRWHLEIGARMNRTAESRTTDTLEIATATRTQGHDNRNVIRGAGFAGFTWTAWSKGPAALNLYANYRNTYKPAAIDFGLDADTEILDPETAKSYEGGARTYLMNRRLSIELSAFQMDFRNLVLSQNIGGTPELVNGGTQRFRGLELATALRLIPAFEWRLAYSLHDARFRDFLTEFGGVPTQLRGNRLEMSARNMAASELIVGRDKGWRGNARANWVGSRFLNKRNTAPSRAYITWSGGVGYVLGDVEFRLDGYNLNNQRPPVSESELGDAQYYLLPARSLVASARWLLGGASN